MTTGREVNIEIDLRRILVKLGRMAIEYVAADQICRHALGTGIDGLMPAEGWGTFAALYVTDLGLMRAWNAIKGRKGGEEAAGRQLVNESAAELKGGVWLVTGVENGMVTVMDPEEFRRLEAKIAKDGGILTKVMPGEDGTVTTMRYASGKLHAIGRPAVVRTKDGDTVEELWFEGGRRLDGPRELPAVGPVV